MYNEDRNFMLPTAEYTEASALSSQVEKLFDAAPEYVGHEIMASNLHDQIPLPTTEESCFLINTDDGYKVYVNSCPHRSKKLVTLKTSRKDIRCSAHLFVYDSVGELRKAPGFEACPNLKLHSLDVTSKNGMLFRTPKGVDIVQWLSDMPEKAQELMNMDGYKYYEATDKADVIVSGHWILVMELTDDLLHIPHVHPTLNKLVKIEPVLWEYFDNGFLQTLDFNRSILFMDEDEVNRKFSKPGHATALRYVKVLRNIIKVRPDLADDPSLQHVYMFSIFPGTQIEALPFLRIVENTRPYTTSASRQILEFYYKDDLPKQFEAEFLDASIEFFTQFDAEDDFLIKEQQEGVEFLNRYGINNRGPVHPTLEAGAQYRHLWIGRKLGLI
jgi:phenylpropionate dioxygenase-like ring-hydroxylating dioxygenase large terminal subunit